MAAKSPLQMIYEGKFPESLLASPASLPLSQKVEQVVTRYHQLLQRFPPDTLESLGHLPPEMLQEMAEIGLFGLSIPAAYGGLGFSIREWLKVVEEMVRLDMASALASLAHLSIGVKGIELFGNESQKQKYLVPAASGAMIFSYALTEPKVGSDAQHIETRAELSSDGHHYLLSGQKTYITNANYAGALTVFAQMDQTRPGFMGAFIVETGWAGVKIGKDMPKMGLKASSTAAIQLRDVRVPAENLLGAPGDGFKIAMTIINYGRLGLGAASLGMMRQSLADMKKRSASRLQFGVPIKSFPLIQEKLVKARVNSFVAAAMNDFTAALLQQDPTGNLAIETSHCKLFGTTRAWDTLYDAFQVAGGSAYLTTNPYEKRLRDFRVATVFEGTTEIHSIYPAVSSMRNLEKQLRASGGTGLSRLRFLFSQFVKSIEWPMSFADRTMKKASKLARANAGAVRRLLILGLLLHGKRVSEKQFLLRRITTLSLYLYALLTIVTIMSTSSQPGLAEKGNPDLLRWFLEEARAVRKTNRSFFDSRQQNLIEPLLAALFRSAK
jgi:acyl-CoA dehydrogenase family member 9